MNIREQLVSEHEAREPEETTADRIQREHQERRDRITKEYKERGVGYLARVIGIPEEHIHFWELSRYGIQYVVFKIQDDFFLGIDTHNDNWYLVEQSTDTRTQCPYWKTLHSADTREELAEGLAIQQKRKECR